MIVLTLMVLSSYLLTTLRCNVRVLSNCDVSRLQRALDALADWADLWQLSISFSKCSVLVIGKSTVPLDGLHIRNNVLNVTRTNVDLGITVTDDFKPRAHINIIVTKAHQRANAILRCFLSVNIAKACLPHIRSPTCRI